MIRPDAKLRESKPMPRRRVHRPVCYDCDQADDGCAVLRNSGPKAMTGLFD